ncbi:GNAT family N-acetyltransferase [Actinomyces timonensis]|uniref:GNAT family N-acetyltransferase n=1 Tax=Actinomyces timonensis TaxID=1288391 RepID=UPI00030E5AE5|nr:GNAT family N-acetyltransferase [Actinomyces timonensis]
MNADRLAAGDSRTSLELRPGGPGDLDAVAVLLTGAFADDPVVRVIIAAAPDPLAALDHLHRVTLGSEYLVADDEESANGIAGDAVVDLAVDGDGRVLGAALWDRIDRAPKTPADLEGDGAGGGIDLALLGDAWGLLTRDTAACLAERPARPHWYLYLLAVDAGARGMGIGSALLDHGLARADASGLPAHLEATSEGAARLYERHGFRTTATIAPGAPLPSYRVMTREASATS